MADDWGQYATKKSGAGEDWGQYAKAPGDATSEAPAGGTDWGRYARRPKVGQAPERPRQKQAVSFGERLALQNLAPPDAGKKADWLKQRGYEAQALPSGQVAARKKGAEEWGVIDERGASAMDILDVGDEVAFGVLTGMGGASTAAAGPMGLLAAGGGAAVGGATAEAGKKALGAMAGFHEEPGEILADVATTGALGGALEMGLRGSGRAIGAGAKRLFRKAPEPKPEGFVGRADRLKESQIEPAPTAAPQEAASAATRRVEALRQPTPAETAGEAVAEVQAARAAQETVIPKKVTPRYPDEPLEKPVRGELETQLDELLNRGKLTRQQHTEEMQRLRAEPPSLKREVAPEEWMPEAGGRPPPAVPDEALGAPRPESGSISELVDLDPSFAHLSAEQTASLKIQLDQVAQGHRPPGMADDFYELAQEWVGAKSSLGRKAAEGGERIAGSTEAPMPPAWKDPGIPRQEAKFAVARKHARGLDSFFDDRRIPYDLRKQVGTVIRYQSPKETAKQLDEIIAAIPAEHPSKRYSAEELQQQVRAFADEWKSVAPPLKGPPVKPKFEPTRPPEGLGAREPRPQAKTMPEFRPTAKPVSQIRGIPGSRGKLKPEPPPIRGGVGEVKPYERKDGTWVVESPDGHKRVFTGGNNEKRAKEWAKKLSDPPKSWESFRVGSKPTGPPTVSGKIEDIHIRPEIRQQIDDVVEDLAGGKLEISTVSKLMEMGRGKLSNSEMNEVSIRSLEALNEARAAGLIDDMQQRDFSQWLKNLGFGKAAGKAKPAPKPKGTEDVLMRRGGATIREVEPGIIAVEFDGTQVGRFANNKVGMAEAKKYAEIIDRSSKLGTVTPHDAERIDHILSQAGYEDSASRDVAVHWLNDKFRQMGKPRTGRPEVRLSTNADGNWALEIDGKGVVYFYPEETGLAERIRDLAKQGIDNPKAWRLEIEERVRREFRAAGFEGSDIDVIVEEIAKRIPKPRPGAKTRVSAERNRHGQTVVMVDDYHVATFDGKAGEAAGTSIRDAIRRLSAKGKAATADDWDELKELLEFEGVWDDLVDEIVEEIAKRIPKPPKPLAHIDGGTIWLGEHRGSRNYNIGTITPGHPGDQKAAKAIVKQLEAIRQSGGRLLKGDESDLRKFYRDLGYGDADIKHFLEKIREELKRTVKPPIYGGAGDRELPTPEGGAGKFPRDPPQPPFELFKKGAKAARTASDVYGAAAHGNPRAIFSLAIRLAEKYTPKLYEGASEVVKKSLARISRVLENQGRKAALAAAYAIAQKEKEFKAWLESQSENEPPQK